MGAITKVLMERRGKRVLALLVREEMARWSDLTKVPLRTRHIMIITLPGIEPEDILSM